MELILRGKADEIAALASAVQGRQSADDAFVDEIAERMVTRLAETYRPCDTP